MAKTYTENKQLTPLAKPRYDLVFSIGKGTLDLSASTIDLLMYISPYVDLDLRINIDLFDVKQSLQMQYRTFYHALFEAESRGLLEKRGSYYYSNFHILTDGKNGGTYQKLLKEFTSPVVLNYTLNVKRFFYYCMARSFNGHAFKSTVENLYKNKLQVQEFGISYFENYIAMATSLFELIRNDQITVQLLYDEKKGKGPILTADTPNFENIFHEFCEYDPVMKRKTRTSKYKSEKHKIKIKVTERVVKDELDVCASICEFNNLADHYGICHEDMSDKTKNIMISYKNELFNRLGVLGIDIFRNALELYLKENARIILEADLVRDKAANYLMDFYILKEVENILVGAALQPRLLAKKNHLHIASISCAGYLVPIQSVDELLRYFMDRGSENHIILLDAAFNSKNINFDDLNWSETWDYLQKDILSIYRAEYTSDLQEKISLKEWKSLKRNWAEKGILSIEKDFKDTVHKLKEKIFFINVERKRNQPVSSTENKTVPSIPFYNWLES